MSEEACPSRLWPVSKRKTERNEKESSFSEIENTAML